MIIGYLQLFRVSQLTLRYFYYYIEKWYRDND